VDFFAPRKVLFVDDDESNCLLFEATMEDHFAIEVATSAEAALAIIAQGEIDVLLTDHRMPGMSGVELCERVAESHPHIERLLVTAYVDTTSAVAAINQARVSRYLSKPWDPDELMAAVRQSLDKAMKTRVAHELEEERLRRERATALATIQARVLHDLANASSQLSMGCDELGYLVEPLRDSDPDRFADIDVELSDMRIALQYLTDLHLRVRGLNRTERHPELVDVHQILSTVARLVRSKLPRGVSLEVDAPAGLLVHADRTDLVRILVNLATNATQSVESEGRVQLSAASAGEVVGLEVRDDGPGVPAELRGRIFDERFTTRREGTGLGLPTSRRLAEDNGGTLVLLDEGPGACFRLTVPAREPQGRPAADVVS